MLPGVPGGSGGFQGSSAATAGPSSTGPVRLGPIGTGTYAPNSGIQFGRSRTETVVAGAVLAVLAAVGAWAYTRRKGA